MNKNNISSIKAFRSYSMIQLINETRVPFLFAEIFNQTKTFEETIHSLTNSEYAKI